MPVHGSPRVQEHLDSSNSEGAPQSLGRLPFRINMLPGYIDGQGLWRIYRKVGVVENRAHWSRQHLRRRADKVGLKSGYSASSALIWSKRATTVNNQEHRKSK